MPALDEFLPVYSHRERHSRTIAAPPERTWDALLAVTAAEMPLSRVLMGIRATPVRLFGARGGRRADPRAPLISLFLRGGFRLLNSNRPRVLVAGTAIQPWRLARGGWADVGDAAGFRDFSRPGFVLAAISFELEPTPGATTLATETRVQPTDSRAARAFRPYWLVIRGGSGLIRRDLLRAVARRAEKAASVP